DAIGGEKLQAAVESILQASRPAGDTRTRAQQLADALVQLADNVLSSGDLPTMRTVKPQVIITIPLEDLIKPPPGAGAGRTGFGGVISAAKARWPACDSTVIRVVMGPDGQPLDLGRTHHVAEWVQDQGPTSLENSALLCERHHTEVHHGFRVERRPDGRWRTWRPDGTEIVVHESFLVSA
ncbi:protein of unknown function, partial [Blastococcus aurantiacus]